MGNLVGRSLAHFRIEAELGQGGMGVVYRATDEKLRRQVALKVLPNAFAKDEDRRRRFLREARSAAAITHANIATVHDVGEADGHVFIAMELVEGETLRARIEKGMSVADAVRIAKEIARGLARAHEKGIVHRDLKPENVMITRHDEVKILDFGLAKPSEESTPNPSMLERAETETNLTRVGRVLGTPAYMSPEQARGAEVDARTDVFAFGVVLYEMLTRARPFAGETTQDVLAAIMRDAPMRVSERNPLVSVEIDRVIERCLEKQRDARYANGQDLVEALNAVSAESRDPNASSGQKGLNAPTVSLLTPEAATVGPRTRGRWRWGFLVLAGVAALGLARYGSHGRRGSPANARSPHGGEETASPPSSLPPLRARRLAAISSGSQVKDAELSPDGAQLAFLDTDGLWLQAVAGGARARLGIPSDLNLRGLSFFPDGRRLLLAGDHLWVVSLDGGEARQLADRPGWRACSACSAVISPDGLSLALRDENAILVAPVDGDGPARTVATLSRSKSLGPAARFSPDGRHLAYLDEVGGNTRIMVARVDGTGSTKLFETPFRNHADALVWPSAHRVVFGARNDADGTCALQEIAVDIEGQSTSPPRDLWVTRGDQLGGLTVAAGRMAFVVADIQYQVFVATVSSDGSTIGPPRQLTKDRSMNYRPRWMPDGRVAFVSTRDARRAIYVQGLDDPHATLLVAPPLTVSPLQEVLRTGEVLYLRPTGPDGGSEARLFGVIPGGAEHAFEVLTTGPPATGISGLGAFALRCAAGDPSRCVIAEGRPTVDLSRIDLAEGHRTPLRSERCEAYDVAVAPDARTIALMCGTGDEGHIAIVTGDSFRAFAITPARKAEMSGISFASSGRSLIMTDQQGDSAQSTMLEVGLDGHARAVLSSSRGNWLYSPTVSLDGKMLAWHEVLVESELWLLESAP
jgi:serine/threonine protein kinase